ncbi:EpsD family peptidyl-prolyl cis-trans isomerase [Alteromonas australica]|uniref:EpsD family peptidyl-prolyl cis-trans isomerase n=1 Tax=Alteromonas australica TaxID=589873 RepID=UPI002352DC93|nr:EpsD family peptidyl-prolyl cis-trans isomerase [Alteromonas australica]|tara:strand:- start:1928 stop:2779 length:852 start_codon:yes stop_codon:yes gene_type:complete
MIDLNLKHIVIFSSILLWSCSKESNVEEVKDSSQVAARVDAKEITVHQITQVLKSQPKQSELANSQLVNTVLDQLISQELLFQQAQKMKLDRDPDTLLAIEAAKKQIIVDAYLRKVLASSSSDIVTDDEINAYFKTHPKFFDERKKFIYAQLAVQLPKESEEDLIQRIHSVDSIESLIPEIKSKQFPYKYNQQIQSTEKIPKVLVEPLYSLSEGDIGYLNMDDGLLILAVKEAIAAPVSLEESRSEIEKYLYTEKRKDDIEQLVLNLREAAQIEYVGEFKPID